jgi:hypothetical protein
VQSETRWLRRSEEGERKSWGRECSKRKWGGDGDRQGEEWSEKWSGVEWSGEEWSGVKWSRVDGSGVESGKRAGKGQGRANRQPSKQA